MLDIKNMSRNDKLQNLFLAVHYLAALETERYKKGQHIQTIEGMDSIELENKMNQTFREYFDEYDIFFKIVDKSIFRFDYSLFKKVIHQKTL